MRSPETWRHKTRWWWMNLYETAIRNRICLPLLLVLWGIQPCTWSYVMLWHVMECFGMLCNVMACHGMLWHVMECFAMLCDVLRCFAMLCDVMRCFAMFCDVLRCFAMICDVLRWYAIFCDVNHGLNRFRHELVILGRILHIQICLIRIM